jgi:hypothetical protein
MKFLHTTLSIFNRFFLISFLFSLSLQAAGAWDFSDNFHLKGSGQITKEAFISTNINLLNSRIMADDISYVLSTLDYYLSADYGQVKNPRLSFYSDFRFRYLWGSCASAEFENGEFYFTDGLFKPNNNCLLRHVVWMRESWVKVMFGGDIEKHKHCLQMGLIPFEIGRGISLGSAYDVAGFLGFTPTYSINQYAPALLLKTNLTPKTFFNVYAALLEVECNDKDKRACGLPYPAELNTFDPCFFTRKSFAVIVQQKTCFENNKKTKTILEPYLMYLSAPDKSFEAPGDVDAQLVTFGFAVEVEQQKINWGFECACNLGGVFIKPWDRNKINIIKQSDGVIAEQYTKIYDKNQLDTTAKLVEVTSENKAYVDASAREPQENGKQIGPNLFNAYNRFRPAQNVNMSGYFYIADAEYDCIAKVLQIDLGVGYFSGDSSKLQDANKMSSFECLNQSFSGFVPIQSIYSGKRIRHMVMFNQGIPRFIVQNAEVELGGVAVNPTPSIMANNINTTTNISFLGTRAAWNIERLKKYSVLFAPNIIAYWSPETFYVKHLATKNRKAYTSLVQNYLGTEVNFEFSSLLTPDLKLAGYAGVLFPGSYYKDLIGTIVKQYELPMANNVAFVCDIALSYTF